MYIYSVQDSSTKNQAIKLEGKIQIKSILVHKLINQEWSPDVQN